MRRGGEFFCAAALAVAMTAPAAAADLVIAMPPWPSGQAAANILKFGIAKKFSLDAEVRELGTLNAFVGLEKGEIDIQPEVWRPNFDELVRKFVTD
ncbi:glycine betaine ABC transporter substrate-binding protein, partial [Sinorhizobium medicae]|uniref:glycine betaine ABC transporter substrate-binding protein n=1 Tax=Sinorhizobium medicae TaxID=110321 RepID=UPI000FE12507